MPMVRRKPTNLSWRNLKVKHRKLPNMGFPKLWRNLRHNKIPNKYNSMMHISNQSILMLCFHQTHRERKLNLSRKEEKPCLSHHPLIPLWSQNMYLHRILPNSSNLNNNTFIPLLGRFPIVQKIVEESICLGSISSWMEKL